MCRVEAKIPISDLCPLFISARTHLQHAHDPLLYYRALPSRFKHQMSGLVLAWKHNERHPISNDGLVHPFKSIFRNPLLIHLPLRIEQLMMSRNRNIRKRNDDPQTFNLARLGAVVRHTHGGCKTGDIPAIVVAPDGINSEIAVACDGHGFEFREMSFPQTDERSCQCQTGNDSSS